MSLTDRWDTVMMPNYGTPPVALKARFPDMVPEVARSFDRSVQGRLSLLRIGWAVIRPK